MTENFLRDALLVELSKQKRPIKITPLARRIAMHRGEDFKRVDLALGRLEFDGLVDTTRSGAWFLTPIARHAGAIYGFAGLKKAENYLGQR